jgi:tRNA(His) 5'-end guanylyltransferase
MCYIKYKENAMDLEYRMKAYEAATEMVLPLRAPVILRVDGRAFHTLTRGLDTPFDAEFAAAIDAVAGELMREVQNARCAYIQSDEVSVLLVDYNRFDSQQWFGGNIQKMTSISAGIASVAFTAEFGKKGVFDSRVFMVPERDIKNYFIWRQRDATRNSIQMVSRKYYSHKEVFMKNLAELQEMIFKAGDNWNNYQPYWKRGRMYDNEGIISSIPVFTQEPEYLDRFLEIEEE